MDVKFRGIHLQKSAKELLDIYDEPTNVSKVNGQQVLKLCHPTDVFAVHVSGYIASLVPPLKCRMDVPPSDPNGMVLHYLSSYVSNPARSLEMKYFSVEY